MNEQQSSPSSQEPVLPLPESNTSINNIRASRSTLFGKFKMMIKAGVIVFLTLLLMIPTFWIHNLVDEREQRKSVVSTEIESKWAGKQTFYGPVLILPYKQNVREGQNNASTTVTSYAFFLPDDLSINGDLQTQVLHRSIYSLPVYLGKLSVKGSFKDIPLSSLNIPPEDVLWDEATLSFQVSDTRGIQEQITCKWNDSVSQFYPGSGSALQQGLDMVCGVKIRPEQAHNQELRFSFDVSLRGADSLFFIPSGAQTQVELSAPWNSPAFDGSSLPSLRTLTDSSFTASWTVPRPNGVLLRSWTNRSTSSSYYSLASTSELHNTSFGVRLVMPVSSYQVTTRAVKYAIMVIGLTFMLFFFIEILGEKSIHPFQYILVGLALVIFYSLLLSFSEHLSFNLSYITAAGMTTLLVALYTASILRDKKFSLLTGGALTVMYGFIFTILQMEDYSLMVGSLGLFITLAAVMYFSRRIDWYGVEEKG